MARATRGLSVPERIALFSDKSGGPDACWPWTGSKGNSGTATMIIAKRSRSVRRVLWELTFGPVPEGIFGVGDTCGDRGCMNPAHFRLRSSDPAQRLWDGCDRSGGEDACWPWKGHCYGAGYGSSYLHGQGKVPAHRIAWEAANGQKVPKGMVVCHRCDNPPCCNPKHLFIGTEADNMQDMHAKGRHPGRGRLPRAVPENVREEVLRLKAEGLTQKRIAKALGLTRYAVAMASEDRPAPSTEAG